MNDAFATKLKELLADRDRLFDVALGVLRSDAAMRKAGLTESFVRRVLDAFLEIVREAIDGDARASREELLRLTLPAILQTTKTESVVQTNVAFFVALSIDLTARMPEDLRAETTAFLARFAGEYVADVVRVAGELPGR